MKRFTLLMMLMSVLLLQGCDRQETADTASVHVFSNQLGFFINGPKHAFVKGELRSENFVLAETKTAGEVFKGKLKMISPKGGTERKVWMADFSDVSRPGEYTFSVDGQVTTVHIEREIYLPLLKGLMKGYYYQRASVSLPEVYAGKWARAAGHPDDHVALHASALSQDDLGSESKYISAPKGWYDAGDYNKYIVNSGITMGTLLSLYEDFPRFMAEVSWEIPESKNALPDLLDEVMWNLEWMLKMQDPDDGGVYHKLTTAKFEGSVSPAQAQAQRYVVMKSTAATLDFAAVTAQAARVLKTVDEPGMEELASECMAKSRKAWDWAMQHPEVLYDQEALNERFDPDIQTGAYGDKFIDDERTWAACELFISTGEQAYLQAIDLHKIPVFSLPSWSKVDWLGYYSLLRYRSALPGDVTLFVEKIATSLRKASIDLRAKGNTTVYQTIMGTAEEDFVWGSNSVAANQGIMMLQAYLLEGEEAYLRAAMSNLDYLLGRNETGYCFVTGYGRKSPMHPHHRPSESDEVALPVPGLLVGGPNPGQQDGCDYPSDLPSMSYVDAECSYASNEIAINWNAPMVYLVGAVSAIYGAKKE